MSHRVIRAPLLTASRCEVPQFARNSRSRGVKHQGVKYERALAKILGKAWTHGQWFQFHDSAGAGWCQTDLLRELEDCVVVLEAKLSWVPEGKTQIDLLYRPVLQRVFSKPVVGIVVCKLLAPGIPAAIAQNLPSALTAARNGADVVLHWLGKAPLSPPKPAAPFRPLNRPTTALYHQT